MSKTLFIREKAKALEARYTEDGLHAFSPIATLGIINMEFMEIIAPADFQTTEITPPAIPSPR
jgi:hypothetical protein